MPVRMAAVAGRFYDASPRDCLKQIQSLLPQEPLPADLPRPILGGIVPHAGWVFSGATAARVFAALAQARQEVETFVIFGAIHTVRVRSGLLYESGQWGTPLGTIDIDEKLAQALLDQEADFIVPDRNGHAREHSIEVQVPFIQHLFPRAKILPLMVPPVATAPDIGRAVAAAIADTGRRAVCLASTDLTHYGPSYLYTPRGIGPDALRWAKETNDRFFLDLALRLEADKLVESSEMYANSCGPGAVAALLAALKDLGATRGVLLAHTTSAEIMAQRFGRPETEDSVGYAAVVYG